MQSVQVKSAIGWVTVKVIITKILNVADRNGFEQLHPNVNTNLMDTVQPIAAQARVKILKETNEKKWKNEKNEKNRNFLY